MKELKEGFCHLLNASRYFVVSSTFPLRKRSQCLDFFELGYDRL
jgi:hypothetical protein